ncbi:MAG: transcription elongation factor GreB [Gammaproteobacteria bacterium]|nr:transcription elongation factor GreB [Gammaproteobacteria bacterium]
MSQIMALNYITATGKTALQKELDYLWKQERPEWTQRVSDAAKEGDRSENAEYIYSKKKLREIDRRIRFLSKRLDVIEVVARLPSDQSRVFFGAWVTLDSTKGQVHYRLVGSDEINAEPGYISINSPLAQQLIGKSVGDVFSLAINNTENDYEILNIEYTNKKI